METAALGLTATNGLLAIALQEGMIQPNGEFDDGLVEALKARVVPAWYRQQLFEQVVLNEHFVTAQNPFFLEGDLLESGWITTVPVDGASAGAKYANIRLPELIIAMAKSRGKELHANTLLRDIAELEERATAISVAFVRLGLLEPADIYGGDLEGLFALQGLIWSNSIRADEARRLLHSWGDLRTDARPYVDATGEIHSTWKLASTAGVERVFLPRGDAKVALPATFPPGFDDARPHVLRLAVDGIGVLPTRQTLKETMELSASAAAQDLRGRIAGWEAEFERDPMSAIESIQRQVRTARRLWSIGDDMAIGGRWVTWAGIAASIASSLVGAPAELGVGLAIFAAGYDVGNWATQKAVRWVSFGSVGT